MVMISFVMSRSFHTSDARTPTSGGLYRPERMLERACNRKSSLIACSMLYTSIFSKLKNLYPGCL